MVDLEVEVTDPDGDAMDVSFYDALDDSLIGTVTGVASGQTALVWWDLYDSMEIPVFSWYVKVSDGDHVTRSETWMFSSDWASYYCFNGWGDWGLYEGFWPSVMDGPRPMCRGVDMEEWVVSLLYGILDRPSYRDMTILGNIACDTYLYTYGDGEEYYLYTEGATRENSYNFIPYTGASYDYADEVCVFREFGSPFLQAKTVFVLLIFGKISFKLKKILDLKEDFFELTQKSIQKHII